MPLRRTLTATALGFLALTLVMGCVHIDPSTARGKEALAVRNLAAWYGSQPYNQRNPFLEWWFYLYYLNYENYLTPDPSIPVSFNTSGPQNTMQMLTTVTIPPTLPPQQQTLPLPPPPPAPVSTPPGPQPPP